MDPTKAESESGSEEESSTPLMLHVWHSPTPARQMLTRLRPMCPPDPHPPPAQQSLSDPSQPRHVKTASLHQVIQGLHDRAAQPNPSIDTPRKKRQYGSDGMIRHELTSKKQLARRGGFWDVIGDNFYLASDQSDSEEEDYAIDKDEDN